MYNRYYVLVGVHCVQQCAALRYHSVFACVASRHRFRRSYFHLLSPPRGVPMCTCSNIITIIICMTGTSVRRISEIPHKMRTTCLLASRTHYTIRTRFNNNTHTHAHINILYILYYILDPS